MNEITAFADRLCLTLLHSLWQATAIVLLVSLIVRLARLRAEIGYAAWMSGLMAAVVCVPVTYVGFTANHRGTVTCRRFETGQCSIRGHGQRRHA